MFIYSFIFQDLGFLQYNITIFNKQIFVSGYTSSDGFVSI